MIGKTMASLALLKTMYRSGIYIVDCYIPLLSEILINHKIKNISEEESVIISGIFLNEYGLVVPFTAIPQILKRMKGVVGRRNNNFTVNIEKLPNSSIGGNDSREKQIESMLNGFKEYCSNEYGEQLADAEVDNAFTGYLSTYCNEILSSSKSQCVLPPIENMRGSKRLLFMLGEYLKLQMEDQNVVNLLVDMSLGMVISESIFMSGYQSYRCNYSKLTVYLDVHFLYYFVGIGGDELSYAYRQFIKQMRSSGMTIKVLDYNLDEFHSSLDDCANWIDSPDFDYSKAGKSLLFFYKNELGRDDIELYRSKIEDIFSDPFGAILCDNNQKPKEFKKQDFESYIDEKALKGVILRSYSNGTGYIDSRTSSIVDRDISAISYVYRMRKRKRVRNIKDVGHLFVTGNQTLAYSVNKYHQAHEHELGLVPSCVSGQFLCNLLWVENPGRQLLSSSIKWRIVANVMEITKISASLLVNYMNELTRLKNNGEISVDSFNAFRHNMMLEQSILRNTRNDPEFYQNSMVTDFLGSYNKEIARPYKEQIENTKKANLALKEQLENEKANYNNEKASREYHERSIQAREEKQIKHLNRMARIPTWGGLVLLVGCLMFVNFFADYSFWIKLCSNLVAAFLFVGNVAFDKTKNYLHKLIFHYLLRKRCREQEIDYKEFCARNSIII